MSTLPSTMGPAPDESRLELALAALRSERRNRPRALIILASLVLVGAVIYLFWTLAARASASTALGRASSSLANIQGVVDQLKTAQDQRDNPRFNPDTNMVSKLQEFARQVGLPAVEVTPKEATTAGAKGFTKRTYSAVISEADPELLLHWVSESVKNFPGLEIEMLKLTPGRTLESGKVAWSLDVAFRRWERLP